MDRKDNSMELQEMEMSLEELKEYLDGMEAGTVARVALEMAEKEGE